LSLSSSLKRIVAVAASTLLAVSTLVSFSLPARAATVGTGNCVATVDNSSGVSVTASGGFCFVAFKTTGITYSWTKPAHVAVIDLLVVAGGGGGGARHAGGGGAGGLIQLTATQLTASTVSISVGAGGAGAPASSGAGAAGTNGSNSVVSATGFTTQTAIGGGAGTQMTVGNNGGSGGGGSCCVDGISSGTAGQGNSGSRGATGTFNGNGYWVGGAGGGAGAAATAGTSSAVGGIGGAGASISWISSTARTQLAVGVNSAGNTFFAGGGGGGTAVFGTAGGGGVGGGAAGGAQGQAGSDATANTGGGGGGGGMNADNSVPRGGNGGSGVVVIRYAQAAMLSYNVSDINSYDASVGTAINDLSPGGTLDGTLVTGSNGQSATLTAATGALQFNGGYPNVGPYIDITPNISTTPFNANGMTIDFEADFGATAENWERIIDFSEGGLENDNILLGREGTTNNLILSIFHGAALNQSCIFSNAIPVNSGMNRWTVHFDGTNCRMYKNGSLVHTQAFTSKPLANLTWSDNFIARSNWAQFDSSFEGSIRSVSIFEGALAPANIPAFSYKTVTSDALAGGVSTITQTRFTSGSIKLPTPSARPGYTFTGWFTSNTFATKVGDPGAVLTPSANVNLFGAWKTVDPVGNLVMNIDATNISSVPATPNNTNITSIYPGNAPMSSSSIGNVTRDTANSPGALNLTSSSPSFVSMGANNAATFGGAMTFETWFKCTAYRPGAAWNIIATHWFAGPTGGAASGSDWHFGIYNDRLQVNAGTTLGFGNYVFSSADCANNKWMLLGFTIDASSNLQIYINGQPDGSLQAGKVRASTTNANLTIGDGRADAHARGYYSRVRLYNTALTGTQVLSNFRNEATTFSLANVTYAPGPNGTGSDIVDSYSSGTSVTLRNATAPITRTGYSISGWTTSSTAGASQTNALSSALTLNSDLTLYPVWSANTYTLTYAYNGATGGNSTTTANFTTGGTAITLPTPTRTGFSFGGWHSDAGLTTLVSGAQSPTASATLYAKWTQSSFTITYAYNGATGGNSTATSSFTTGGTAVTLPTPTRTGYTFGGWYAEVGLTTLVSGAQSPTADTTLYAKWNVGTYTLTYTYNGATGGNSTLSSSFTTGGTAITLPAPTRTGYTFGGWYAEVGLTTLVSGAQSPTASATLFAKWNAGTYTLTYNYNGATGGNSTVSSSFTTGGTAITLPAPTRTGYNFGGWFSDVALTTSVTGAQTPSADATLYAKWNNGIYTLTYSYNGATGGNGTAADSFTTGGTAITLPIPTRTGYTFGGWYAEVGLTTLVSGAQSPTASGTLYAKWNAATFTLTYSYNGATGGNANATASYTTGGTAITLPTPTRTGYTFNGWFAESTFATAVTGAQTPSANATIYAKYTAINYGLTYNANSATSGAVPVDATNYNIGSNASVSGNSGNLVRTGYSFAGWTLNSGGTGTVYNSGDSLLFGAAAQVLYAKWAANTYTITYNVNGATGTQANSSDSYTTAGSAVTLSAVGSMVKTGYNFGGWSTTANGAALSGAYTTAVDVTLYAVWTIRSINVTYSKGSASSASFISFPANTASNYATRVTLSNNVDSSVTYSSQTYAFVGWSDGTSIYQSGAQYLLGATDVTFTAIWTPAYGVRYIFNGGTAANGTSAIDAECLVVGNLCTDQQVVTANAAPTRPGYTFTGWTDQSNNSIAAGSTFTVTINSYLLYAGWQAINYSVTYVPNGGNLTPTQSALRYGDTFALAAAPTRTGYIFAGWSDGSNTFGSGANYSVGLSAITLTAQWTPRTYTVSFDWNGSIGSSVASQSYTVGTTGLTLPGVGNQVKDGFQFGGWAATVGGDAVATPYVATANTTLYAIWGQGSYSVTYTPNFGSQASNVVTVANGSSTVLPTLTRNNFVFDGWFTAPTGGSKVGNGGANYTPSASRQLYARWTQSSLLGVIGNLNRISTITASDTVDSTYTGSNGGSGVSVTVPRASLPAGTVVNLDLITDNSYAQTLLTGTNNYILSLAVSWLALDETVPDTNSGTSISLTITNPSIRAGALIYSVQNGVATLLGTATANNTLTVQLTADPSIYVVSTVPSLPRTVTSMVTSNSATLTWTAPVSDGGATISGYTVTLNTGAVCTTLTLTCTFNNLIAGTTYTATIVATNTVGSSVSVSTSFTPTAPIVSPPVVVPPVVVPPVVVPPVVSPPAIVVIPVVTAVEKVLANNVPVLAGTRVVSPVVFNADSAKLDSVDMAQIRRAAAALEGRTGWLLITGFVKYTGKMTPKIRALASNRAKNVANAFLKMGVKVQIGYLGYGPKNTKSPQNNDRKVEIRWIDKPTLNG
jgi:uncharacterized repeat protein (TIGR02543 family)